MKRRVQFNFLASFWSIESLKVAKNISFVFGLKEVPFLVLNQSTTWSTKTLVLVQLMKVRVSYDLWNQIHRNIYRHHLQ